MNDSSRAVPAEAGPAATPAAATPPAPTSGSTAAPAPGASTAPAPASAGSAASPRSGPPPRPGRPPQPPRPSAPPSAPPTKPNREPAREAGRDPQRPTAGGRRLILGRDADDAAEMSRLSRMAPSQLPDLLRSTIKMRLTALYGGMFVIAGVLLLATVYLLVRQSLNEGRLNLTLAPNTLMTINGVPMTPDQFDQWQSLQQIHQRDAALNSLLQQSLLALLLLSVIAFGFGYVMAGRVLRPLGRITSIAREVAGSNLHRRIDLEGPDDEFKELADTFDDMLDRLDRSLESQRKFVANASHELRTPLAINRTLLEVALGDPEASVELKQLGKTLLATNERSEGLIEGLLLLARSDNELTERKPVDLAEVARRAVDQTGAEAAEREVTLHDELGPAVLQGNGVLLERVAMNLIQNAVRYNRAGGTVDISTESGAGVAVLTVTNTGPVVPAYEVDNMFEPFRRLRTERIASDKGVGLGLSIVRSIVRAHGGWIEVEPREEGGLMMRIGFPIG
ncbi:sensor histidine kinase [Embleya sp. NPDC059237]|uniref:sensor histidine kinase n=1 Tax=Embleya sp. NPDC059237 TaxID=3346784 RepID=UPI0036859095